MSGMVQVVLSLKQETEQKLRRMARELKGGKKGALSAVVTEALDEYEQRAQQMLALEKLRKIADKGLKLGITKFNREDAYD